MTTQLSAAAGAAIRRLRHAKGWTLAELGTRAGVPLSTLSKVELGRTALGYDVLVRLCQALEVEIDHLVRADSGHVALPALSGRRSVVRAGEGETLDVGGLAGRSAAGDLLRRAFTPVVLDVTDARRTGGLLRCPGDSYLRALSGVVVMHSEIYAPLTLEPGDAVFFDGEMGFALTSPDGAPAQVLLIHQGPCVRED